MRLPLTFLLCFILALCARAQEGGAYHIEQFTTENGLPSNGIKGLQWDEKTGFLWIATEAGIVRYNGLSLKPFTPEDEPHITNERIVSLLKNAAGTIVTTDTRGNVFEVEGNRLRFLERAPLWVKQGRLLPFMAVSFALYNHNARFPYGELQLQFTQFLPLSDTATFFIDNTRLFYHSVSGNVPLRQHASRMWSRGFVIGGNLFVVDSANRFYRWLSPTSLEPVDVRDANTGGLANGNRLFWTNGMATPLFFRDSKVWQLVYDGRNLSAQLICDALPPGLFIKYAQYSSKRKTLIIGTDSKGIVVITRNKVVSMAAVNDGTNQRTSYYSQVALPNGNILTNEGHVLGNKPWDPAQLPIKGRFSLSVYADGDSFLYYTQHKPDAPNDHLFRYNGKTGKTDLLQKIIIGDQCLMQRTAGALYLLNNQGINRLEGDSLYPLHSFGAGNPLGNLYDIQEFSPGVLVIVSCRALLRFTVATAKLDTLYNPGSYCVRTSWKHGDYLFFGTYGNGLYAYKNGKVKQLPLDKNKYLLYTHCFVKDRQDNCWISTNKGLFKVPLAQLTEAVEKDVPQLYYHYFGKQDGMRMTELNGGCKPCAVTMKDGTISFPSMDGLLWVNPDSAGVSLPEGDIYLDHVLADSMRIDAASLAKTEIPFGTDQLVFRLAFPAWCNRENITLEYRLKDRDGWKPVRLDEPVELQFGNLPNGEYTLHLRKLDGFGRDNYTYKNIRFTVATPWHRQPLFYLVVSFLVMLLVVSLFNWRTRHLTRKQRRLERLVDEKTRELKKKNEVLEKADNIKTRLISIISHDIVTPLKFLTATSRNLVEKRTAMSDDLQQETLEEMMMTSHELQQLSTNILNWIKYQNESRRLAKETFALHILVDDVTRVFAGVAREKGLLLVNAVSNELTVHQYLEPLKIVVYNLVSNALNFSERGVVRIGATANGHTVTIEVKDEGAGMTEDQVQNILGADYIVSSANTDNKKGNGLGYLIVKDLLKVLHGSLKIESRKGGGTAVSVVLPAS